MLSSVSFSTGCETVDESAGTFSIPVTASEMDGAEDAALRRFLDGLRGR